MSAVHAFGVATLWLGVAVAQPQQAPPQQAPPPSVAPAVTSAVENWLASDLVDQELLQRTVAAVLDDPQGLAWLGERLRTALDAPAERRTKGLNALGLHALLGFIER